MTYNCEITRDGDRFDVVFPDMTNIQTCGFSKEEALAMAKEALDGCLEADISRGNAVPAPAFRDGFPIPVANHIAVALQLRELRGGQSQTDIAKKLGLSYQAYQRLENPRKSNPTIKTLERIAHAFDRELNVKIG
ncbi:MAG: type II toxin-antitoxin system HicB family antitoxin [Spirochaetales bacterium]|jgi:antitoxin HicB|nr:type II toxin-antitoxin system HicB family antitoxin [Spirochaetales bacterium]